MQRPIKAFEFTSDGARLMDWPVSGKLMHGTVVMRTPLLYSQEGVRLRGIPILLKRTHKIYKHSVFQEFYRINVFSQAQRIQATIKHFAENFSDNSFFLMNLLADLTLICSFAFKNTFTKLLKLYTRKNKARRCLSISML